MASSNERESAREHAWRYFQLHAQQRLLLFNFFVVISGLILAGVGACVAKGASLSAAGVVLGLVLMFVAVVFAKLDRRTSFLTKRAEKVLAEMEAEFPECARLFRGEPEETAKAWKEQALWTYGLSFRLVFWVGGLSGLAAVIYFSTKVGSGSGLVLVSV